jgi:uncharacterized protein YPO0396
MMTPPVQAVQTSVFPVPPGPPEASGDVRLKREREEQFRLVRVQSYNWGTFHGLLKLEVSEKGMLFIGPSGSGKSTIFDSHAALLTPPRWLHYNVAARESDTKQDRSDLTYLRGVWGEQTSGTGEIAQQQLRPGPTWAAISEVYRNGLGQVITLAHVYWIKGASNQRKDVHKRYMVAERLLELSELGFFSESGFNARRFKSDLPDVWDTDSFPEYQERMRSRLGIETENALKLLHKTQSAKNLGSLTDFLRDFMLDEPKTHEMAEQLVSQFERLENAHNEVVSAARQIATLLPARELNEERRKRLSDKSGLEEARIGVDFVADELLTTLRVERKDGLDAKLAGEKSQELALERALDAARTTVIGLKQKRDGLGGQQLASLEASKIAAERDEADRRQRCDKVVAACKHLGITMPAKAVGFTELLTQARRELPSATAGSDENVQKRTELTVQKHESDKERTSVLNELAVLARMPGSKMGSDLITIRKLIADGLGYDEGALPFAGELIEVEPAEEGWHGPIERVLKGFSRTMLVPEDLHASVARFVNSTNLRGRIVYLRMQRHSPRTPAPKANGVYRKVSVSAGPFQDWVETELLQHYDAECVETERELDDVAFGITRAGLIKTGGRRHEKDDRSNIKDTRHWVLGGDTRAKAVGLQDRELELSRAIESADDQLEKLRLKEVARVNRALHWQTIYNFSWEELDHRAAALLVTQLDEQIQQLRAASPDLDILEAKISVAEENETNAGKKLRVQAQATMAVQLKLDQLLKDMADAEANPRTPPTPVQRLAFVQRLEAAGRKSTIESMPDDVRFIERELGREIGTLESESARLVTRIEAKFADYTRMWEAESDGLDPTMASFDEFDAKLTRLQVDDLPRFETKFKELLNEQSNQHIALLSNQLEQERRDISDRMDTVNESLAQAEYNEGTHLVIEVEETAPPEAVELKAELRAALSHSLSMDDKEAEARFQNMKRLIRRLASQEPQHVNWKRMALDVRLHVEFVARELDTDDREVQVHRSGAGKSGGQRQKLTATCLAAALRYQLGGPGRQLPTFATIFLDEAFDKADADFTDAAMKIFKSFGFQLIIATPIKSVMTIEPYVGGAVFIHIKDRKHSRALVLPYDDETQSIDFRQVDGSSANDEKS